MWARVVETMLACWLAISPLVFHRGDATATLWCIDLAAAALVAVLALASYWPPTRHAHVAIIAVALALIAAGMAAPYPPAPSDQNHLAVGLLLLLFAIVPNQAAQPPKAWQTFDSAEKRFQNQAGSTGR
jgi:hypothetical protein